MTTTQEKYYQVPIVNSDEWFSTETLEGEEWKDIEGYNGNYKISSYGRVLSKGRKIESDKRSSFDIQEKILKCHYYNSYVKVKLNDKLISVHRLVAKAFIDNPENKSEVDHINTIKDDNRISNLRWVTSTENSNNPLSIEHFNESKNELQKDKICIIDGDGKVAYSSNDAKDILDKLSKKGTLYLS
jgi:hypothetical protein